MSVGTTSTNYGLSATGGRNAAYSAITGSGLWYVVWYDGTHLRDKTSADGVTWSDDNTNIPGGGSGPNGNQSQMLTLLTDVAGNLYCVFGWDNTTGNSILQKRTSSAWFATAATLGGDNSGSAGILYESGSHVYVSSYCSDEKHTYELTDPASAGTGTQTNNYTITQTSAGNNNGVLELAGANVITFAVDGAATPALRTYKYAATTSTGPSFPTPTSQLSNANLQPAALSGNGIAVASDGTTVHVIYRISGTGWIEAKYDGTAWTTGVTLSVMGDNDRYPAIMYDGTTFHLFWCKYNAASDYGIGYAAYLSGTWTAQTDVQAHNSTNRAYLTVSRAANAGKAMLTWLDGTANPWTVQASLVTLATAGTAFIALLPLVITQARQRAAMW